MLDATGLRAWMDQNHTFDLLRLQTLQHYEVGEDLQRYLRGDDGPEPTAKSAWLQRLRSLTAEGRRWRVVHTIHTPLSDYMRYAGEWGYAQNVQAGQDVRVHDITSIPELSSQLEQIGDFYVADQRHVVRMLYDGSGRPVGADPVGDEQLAVPLRAVAELLWRQASPFQGWWQAHPEYHRSGKHAA